MKRRTFLKTAIAASALIGRSAFPAKARFPELTISRIVVQSAKGRRLTPVAPNAYAKYRGYDVNEPIVRIQTKQGLEGIGRYQTKPEVLKKLIGADPFAMFEWDDDVIANAAAAHSETLSQLYGSDVALLDLIGKAMKRPIADLLGKRLREQVRVYDSSLYMEDLLQPNETEGVVYLDGQLPKDPAQRVARKALWVIKQPEGIRILKIKIGRAKWMNSFEEALERDIAVVKAIRKSVGKDITLFVDGNNGYDPRPLAAADFAEAVADDKVYAMEEMFSETKVQDLHALKRRMRAKNIPTKLADGETSRDGVPEKVRAEVFEGPKGAEPLIEIEQADMNANGYLRMRNIARDRARYRMTLAPHNFGSKMGFWSQVHLGLVIPNWEFCETDDSQFRALHPGGIAVKNGLASVHGAGLGVTVKDSALEAPTLVLENF